MPRGSVQKFQGKRGISWRVTVDAGKRVDGGRHQIRRSFATRKEADAFLAQTINALSRGTFSEPSSEPLGDYLRRWVDAAELRGVKPSTQNAYDRIRTYRWGTLAAVPLRALTTAMIEGRIAAELAAGLSPTTLRTGLVVLRAALQDAVDRGELPTNPAARVPLPKQTKKPVRAWTVEEAERVLAVVRADPRWAWQEALVYTLLETGLRIGEAIALTWDDLDLATGTLAVRRTQTVRRDGSRTTGDAKRESSMRDVRLSTAAVAVLKQHRARQNEQEGAWFNDAGLVFPNQEGMMQGRNVAARMLTGASKAAGVPPLTSHGLRHSSATIGLRRGIPVKVLAERLGHKNVAFTLSVYVHPNADDHQTAADFMGEALRPKPPEDEASGT